MSNEWLTIQSFQQSQDLLDAINTLSIHLKLQLSGLEDNESDLALKKAKDKLSIFLKNLENHLNLIQEIETKPLTGIDPRLRQLIRKFAAAKKKKRNFCSDLFRKSPSTVEKILHSNNPKDQKSLIESLAEIRKLLEEHINTDTRRIIGEI